MADLYLTPAERYTAALGGFYYGDLPEPGTVYTQLIKDILDGATPDKEPKNILARFIYSLYISDLGDPYPRYELAKLLYWKLHDIIPTKSGSILTVTIDGKEDYMTINTDLSRLWYKVLFGSKTDVITDFPYIFNTMQNKLSDWELFGNVEVSGTPTPDNPVMPQGTGERTINLFNKNDVEGIRVEQNGVESASNYYILSTFISVDNGVTVSATKLLTDPIRIIRYDANKQFISRTDENTADNIVVDDCAYIRINANKDHWDVNTIQVEYGRTATSYEQYGYKIPISCGGTTTPVYLGEVQTTRQIKKLVLNGTEGLIIPNTDKLRVPIGIKLPQISATEQIMEISTHFIVDTSSETTIPSKDDFTARLSVNSNMQWFFIPNSFFTGEISVANCREQFGTWLVSQYANGTPVTVWYVLAEPETGIVNEPLMRIGDYADSMSRTQTGIDIPTVVGQNTLDVLTTVKPSSMRIEYTSADETRSRSKRISLLKSPLKKGLIK